jgi:cytochrome bd-type quinol oxidase subunit 1
VQAIAYLIEELTLFNSARLSSTQGEIEYAVIAGQKRLLPFVVLRVYNIRTIASLVNGLIVIAILGGLTHFRKEQSTHAQRSWLMVWYVMGFPSGYVFPRSICKHCQLLTETEAQL